MVNRKTRRSRFWSACLVVEVLEHRALLCASAQEALGPTDDCVDVATDSYSDHRITDGIVISEAAGEPASSLDLNNDGVISTADTPLFCAAFDDPSLRAQILIGDANLSGRVDFEDFLKMSANFGRSGQNFGNGDFDCSGDVGFEDFLLMSANFGSTIEYKLPPPEVDTPPVAEEQQQPDICESENVQCVSPGQERYFQQVMATPSTDSRIFYIQPGVELDRLDIIGRHGDEIHFLPGSKVEGSVKSTGDWEPDRGLVNIEASADLLITGLHATNTYQYRIHNVDGDEQSSTALNISWSDNIELRNSILKGSGKVTTWIQGNSTVEMTNTEIDCYYFCIGVWASDLTSKDLVIHQNNEVVSGDRHATFWTSSTMRAPNGEFFSSSNISFTDTTIKKRTGEAIVVGNGGPEYRSNVEFKGTTHIQTTGPAATRKDGWLGIHRNYFGISLHLDGDYPTTRANLATDAAFGEMGRFVIHEYNGTGVGPKEAPLIVCDDSGCVSSIELLG